MAKKTKSFDIRKKLLGAVAMLLVATIMMVSATYAWFTLSTAPEVKGITTTVGANGNLEIALNTTGTAPGTAAVGDSMATQSKVASNVTWGNLVDLNDESYGLNNIALRPAKLLAANNEIGAVALKTPAYGSDGRVKDYVDFRDTIMASYDGAAWTGTGSGVRAIGESSGMTEAELALASAKTSASTARREAKAKITQTLQNNGAALSEAMMKHGLGNGSETYVAADLVPLANIITGMNDAEASIEAAMVASVKAFLASDQGNETAYAAAKSLTTWEQVQEAVTAASVTLPTQFGTIDTALTALKGKITAAQDKIDAAQAILDGGAESLTWDQYKAPLNDLFDTATAGAVTVEGHGVNEVENYAVQIATKLGTGVAIDMNEGSGIFSDFADFLGQYTSSITIPELHLEHSSLPGGGADVENAKFVMTAKTDEQTPFLSAMETVLSGYSAPASSGSENPSVDTTFGYVLDFWVRTNAANSALKLQIPEAQRIYGDSANEETLGEGSYMKFGATLDSGLSDEQIQQLMNAIRIVFMTPNESGYTILAYAKLGAPAADEGQLKSLLELYTPATSESPVDTPVSDTTLMQLTQNQATQLSVMVYLDGDLVDNTMVAATTATSMIGSMNLQFTTDADLQPMQNTALFNGTTTPAQEPEPEPNP